ncbi:MAG: UDP-N-acetylglucosamine 1-carboxyvinyltransferase, partial [Bacteroidales bacterium]|nr:UDP-N-acetylglucosamine 1-carboxyvinyltransferase [Bacteroidales bacterium]
MSTFVIEGGHTLHGEIIPQGAKNEALQVISATLLTPDKVTISNIPEIRDVLILIDLLRILGVEVNHISHGTYSFEARNIHPEALRSEEFRKLGSSLRGSVMVIGPLLARFGFGSIPQPGGDKIGRRRLDTHFLGLQQLGARFTYHPDQHTYTIEAKNLHGGYILLDEASVTGTANIIMTAVLARGTTTIYNAACEPYVQQLCHMLNRMGARISGIGSNLLTIEGVESLHGCEHRLLPD